MENSVALAGPRRIPLLYIIFAFFTGHRVVPVMLIAGYAVANIPQIRALEVWPWNVWALIAIAVGVLLIHIMRTSRRLHLLATGTLTAATVGFSRWRSPINTVTYVVASTYHDTTGAAYIRQRAYAQRGSGRFVEAHDYVVFCPGKPLRACNVGEFFLPLKFGETGKILPPNLASLGVIVRWLVPFACCVVGLMFIAWASWHTANDVWPDGTPVWPSEV